MKEKGQWTTKMGGQGRKEGKKGKRGNGTHTMICNDRFDAELYNQQQQRR
jgi:hypothetical protein